MFLTDRKLERRIEEIEQYRYRDIIEFKTFAAAEEEQGVVNPKLPTSHEQGTEKWYTLNTGDTWKGRDRFVWLHKDIAVPAEWKGKKVVGVFGKNLVGVIAVVEQFCPVVPQIDAESGIFFM